jgi:hypothetical protein
VEKRETFAEENKEVRREISACLSANMFMSYHWNEKWPHNVPIINNKFKKCRIQADVKDANKSNLNPRL